MCNYHLIIIDVQEKLIPVMRGNKDLINNLKKLVKGFNLYQLPIIVSEQVPEKLGNTIKDIKSLLNDHYTVIKKSEFSCMNSKLFNEKLKTINLNSKLILCGIETHICVFQTAKDLIASNYNVEIVTDGISSRKKNDNDTALQMIKDMGAGLTTVEMLLFGIQKNADDDNFKKLSNIIK